MTQMKNGWQIRDLIDLEYFLGQKFREPIENKDADGINFERNAYLSFPDHDRQADGSLYRKRLIRHWLEQRRKQEKEDSPSRIALPGDAFAEVMNLIRILAAAIALVSGAGLTWSLLSYHGREPVNVFTCLWVLVVPQLLLLCILLLSAALHKMRILKSFKIVYPMIAAFVLGILKKIGRFAQKRIDADKANRLRETYGLLGKTRTVYGSVFFWPIFLLSQLFGIFFNIGILVSMFVKVVITDLAFGWQTTLQLAPESILRFVEIVALPWSWLFSPPIAHPTITQISGSQMILKEGIYHLATGDLAAWWPFIFLTVFFYAFMPRLLLAAAGVYLKRRAIESIDFTHSECDRLVMRMKTPEVDTVSKPYQIKNDVEKKAVSHKPIVQKADAALTPAIVMVPEEIFDQFSDSWIEKKLHDSLGMHATAIIAAKMNTEEDSEQLRQILSEKKDISVSFRTVIVQEAWQPPIKESIQWIKSLCTVTKDSIGTVIALVGKPAGDSDFAPPSDIDRMIWEQAISSLGDPYIRVESLGG
ncbi:MAG: DUF2868 domain-containing protein [Desulfobacterales bacterium]